MTRVVIVGGSAAGLRAAQAAVGAADTVVDVVSQESVAPFYRPALSKQMLSGQWDLARAAQPIPTADHLEWHTGRRAVRLDPGARRLELDDGAVLEYDRLLLAGGCRPRTLPGAEDHALVNSADGVLGLRARLAADTAVVIVGAGLIGSEAAATLLGSGVRVTLVDPSPTPLARALGPWADALCMELHRQRGIDLRLGASVAGVERGAHGVEVTTADGGRIHAEEAVVCIGVVPDTDWLVGSGIPLLADGGVACDTDLIVEGRPDIAAAGDLAAWQSTRVGRRTRVEHWMTAVEQGAAAARNLLLDPKERRAFDSVPMFWTEQHGKIIHFVGFHDARSEWSVAEGRFGADGFVASATTAGRVTGYLLFNAPRRISHYRQRLHSAEASTQAVP